MEQYFEKAMDNLKNTGKTIRQLVDEEMIKGKHKYKYQAMSQVAKDLGMNEQTLNLKYYANTKELRSKYDLLIEENRRQFRQAIFNLLDNWAIKQVTKPSLLTYDLDELKKMILELESTRMI